MPAKDLRFRFVSLVLFILGMAIRIDAETTTVLTLEKPDTPGKVVFQYDSEIGVMLSEWIAEPCATPWVTPETAIPLLHIEGTAEDGTAKTLKFGAWQGWTQTSKPMGAGRIRHTLTLWNAQYLVKHLIESFGSAPILRFHTEIEILKDDPGTVPILHSAPTLRLGLNTSGTKVTAIKNRSLTFAFENQELQTGEKCVFNAGPHSGQHEMDNPWFLLQRQTTGDIVFGGIEWSGYWQTEVQRKNDGTTILEAGLAPGKIGATLKTGKTFITPEVFIGAAKGGLDEAGNVLRPWLESYILPPPPEWARGPIYNSWYAFRWDFSEQDALDNIALAQELGLTTFVFDAGWYAGVGDWRSNPERFPNGIKPLINEIHSRGMRAGLWICFQLVAPDHPILKEHPEWAVEPKFIVPFMGDAVLLQLGREDVQAWILEQLEIVAGYGPDWIKYDQDFMPPEMEGSHYEHVRGFYAILDAFHKKHPNIVWETCMSGGQISDIGALSRSVSLWMSDGGASDEKKAETNRHQIRDASVLYPTHFLQRWTNRPEELPWDPELVRWAFRCAMPGTWGICADMRKWRPELLALAKEEVLTAKRLNARKRNALIFRTELTNPGWEALEFLQPREGDAALVLYRTDSTAKQTLIRLRGLESDAVYHVISDDLNLEVKPTGAQLAEGLEIFVGDARSAILWVNRNETF